MLLFNVCIILLGNNMFELNRNLLILFGVYYDLLKCFEVLNHDESHGLNGNIIMQEVVDKLFILLVISLECCIISIFLNHNHNTKILDLICSNQIRLILSLRC